MIIEQRLAQLGLPLPPTPKPIGSYVGAVQAGNLVFVSGHGPAKIADQPVCSGKLGRDLTVEQGYQVARLAIVHCLATLKATIGDLDRVIRIVRILGMVNSTPDFENHPAVINGASDLLVELYGERGRHARSAVGMAALPRGMAVEIEMIVEIV